MTTFAGKNGPAATNTRAIIGAPIGFLAIAIVIVAPPARALWQFAFEHLVNHRNGIHNEWIFRRTNSQPDKVDEITTHDVPCFMLASTICDKHLRAIRVRCCHRLFWIGRRDTNIVSWFTRHEFAAIGDQPFFEVRGEPIRIIEQEVRRT